MGLAKHASKNDPVTKRAGQTDAAREFAVAAARLARDSHGEDIIILDLRDISPITNYFVVATGTSGRQMRSLAEELMALGAQTGNKVWRYAGMEGSDWIVLDFVDCVVHLFDPMHRQYYDLELIWGEAPHVVWE